MPQFDADRANVIKRASDNGIATLITIGTDIEDSKSAVSLAESHEFIYAGVGIHPHEVKHLKDTETAANILKSLAGKSPLTHPSPLRGEGKKKVIAIGETGLDYHYLHSPADMQQRYFRMHIETAIALNLPLIIHTREAKEDTMKILKEYFKVQDSPPPLTPLPQGEGKAVNGIFHCFSGDMDMAVQALAMGFYISFSGVITFKKAENLLEIIKYVPLNRLLIETDAPYLTPNPFRGKRNEPAYVRHTAEKIAEVKGISIEETASAIMKNAEELFKFSR
ncbi:MAG: TatD family hydrolase [Nitrospirae bacterium]|nr:TatD family hydrolase [Nitrospirota bacterium]